MPDYFTKPIITIYCLCDDFLKACGHTDAPQTKTTTAEVMTIALVAAAFFGGNQERSRCFLKEHGYIKKMLGKANLNRRLHSVPETLWQALMHLLAQVHKQMHQQSKCTSKANAPAKQMHQQSNTAQEYSVDSFPVPVCDNIRICRSRLYPLKTCGQAFRGYIASKKRYFYGLRVHLLMTTSGLPVEVMLAPGSQADITAFRRLSLDLPASATVFADKGYLDQQEQALLDEAGLHLVTPRRKNSKSPLPAWMSYIAQHKRKYIETVFSQIASAFGRTVHAVTARGFELKVFLIVLAFTITTTL